jgi:hypothetical protein
MSGIKQPTPPTRAVHELIRQLEKLNTLISAFVSDGRQIDLAGGRYRRFPRVWRFIERHVLTAYAGLLKEQLAPDVHQKLIGLAQRHEAYWAPYVR